MHISTEIKQILVDLAVAGKLPTDLSTLDHHVFDKVIGSVIDNSIKVAEASRYYAAALGATVGEHERNDELQSNLALADQGQMEFYRTLADTASALARAGFDSEVVGKWELYPVLDELADIIVDEPAQVVPDTIICACIRKHIH